jgi:outer membrane lipoprotein SlyB
VKDYKALNLAMSKRRGECPECQKATCACQKKTAAVDPGIRATGEESAANGSDVQTELLRNPFEGPTGNPAQASDFENGYQNAQSLGHLQIAQAQPAQVQTWAKDSPAWRAGFAQAARTMGCGNVAIQVNPNGKVAHMNLISLPTHANDKIASALGTLAGGLMGAGVGAGIGASTGGMMHDAIPAEAGIETSTPVIDPVAHPAMNAYMEPAAEDAQGTFSRALAALRETPRDSFVDGATAVGGGAGALLGGAVAHDMGHSKKQAEYFEAAFKR